jgi:hypothetical protein
VIGWGMGNVGGSVDANSPSLMWIVCPPRTRSVVDAALDSTSATGSAILALVVVPVETALSRSFLIQIQPWT